MRLVAMMPARNEDWIIGLSLRAVLRWCDAAVILDHASEDETPQIVADIAREHPGRVDVVRVEDPQWAEMSHRQLLLERAREMGATHCAITDADEVLTSNLLGVIRPEIERLRQGTWLEVGMPCMWRGLHQYRTDGRLWANRQDLVLAFADSPSVHYKNGADGYEHHARGPQGGRLWLRGYGMPGGVMHLQWASWRRLTAKHARYKVMERVKYPSRRVLDIDRMYSLALHEGGLQLQPAPAEWWAGYEDLLYHARLDREPWHEAEVRRVIEEHGPQLFEGLDLFGVNHEHASIS